MLLLYFRPESLLLLLQFLLPPLTSVLLCSLKLVRVQFSPGTFIEFGRREEEKYGWEKKRGKEVLMKVNDLPELLDKYE